MRPAAVRVCGTRGFWIRPSTRHFRGLAVPAPIPLSSFAGEPTSNVGKFVDGNKRIGAHAMLVFLAVNGLELSYTQQELADIILQVAAGEKGYEDLLAWLLTHQL